VGTWIKVKVLLSGNTSFGRCNLQAMSLALGGITSEEATKLALRRHCTEDSLLAATEGKGS